MVVPHHHFVAVYLVNQQEQFRQGRCELESLRNENKILKDDLVRYQQFNRRLFLDPDRERNNNHDNNNDDAQEEARRRRGGGDNNNNNNNNNNIGEAEAEEVTIYGLCQIFLLLSLILGVCLWFCFLIVLLLPNVSTAPPQCRPDFDLSKYPMAHDVAKDGLKWTAVISGGCFAVMCLLYRCCRRRRR